MPKLYIGNAFSLGMLDLQPGEWTSIRIFKLESDEEAIDTVNRYLERGYDLESYVGHESTAKIISKKLKMKIPVKRIAVETNMVDDVILVFQLLQRIPPATELSEEQLEKIKYCWYFITGT